MENNNTYKIKINKNGYVEGPYINDATQEIQVSKAVYEKISSLPFNYVWKYVKGDFILEALLDKVSLQERRARECFRFIDNRSPLWYNHLTEAQKKELDKWYQDWLDVTDTKVIPVKPDWLK